LKTSSRGSISSFTHLHSSLLRSAPHFGNILAGLVTNLLCRKIQYDIVYHYLFQLEELTMVRIIFSSVLLLPSSTKFSFTSICIFDSISLSTLSILPCNPPEFTVKFYNPSGIYQSALKVTGFAKSKSSAIKSLILIDSLKSSLSEAPLCFKMSDISIFIKVTLKTDKDYYTN